jgi:hypothetical protein
MLVWVKIGYVKSGLNGEISPNLVTLDKNDKLLLFVSLNLIKLSAENLNQ